MIDKAFWARILRRIRALMAGEMKNWETKEGIRFLRRIGLGQGQTVIDFGCGVGHYSIPAAVAVGPRGIVYAIDRDRAVLREIQRKAANRDLANIKTITNLEDVTLELENASADVVLLYDVLHYLPTGNRTAVYREASRVLKNTGFVSVYPKHLAEDCPADHFRNLGVQDLTKEIENAGFSLDSMIEETISHDHSLVPGRVLNFRKKR